METISKLQHFMKSIGEIIYPLSTLRVLGNLHFFEDSTEWTCTDKESISGDNPEEFTAFTFKTVWPMLERHFWEIC